MKKVEAIVRPEKLERLKDSLLEARVPGITINQVIGCGNQHGWKEEENSSDEILNTLPKVEIKLVVPDERLNEIISIICSIAKTDEVGDGKIFVTDISDCIRIRTNEHGDEAL